MIRQVRSREFSLISPLLSRSRNDPGSYNNLTWSTSPVSGGLPVSSADGRRVMVISPRWLQGTVLTFVVGFGILGYLALRVYEEHAPVPERFVSDAGEEVFTHEDI